MTHRHALVRLLPVGILVAVGLAGILSPEPLESEPRGPEPTPPVSTRQLVPPAGTGPTGPPTFCMAPPHPKRRDPAPIREFAPPLQEFRLTPGQARAWFVPADTTRVLFLLSEFADVPFDTAGIDTSGIGTAVDPDTLLRAYFERQLGFIREFYEDVSYGKLVFEPVVSDVVASLPFRMAYYGDDDRFGERGTKLIWDAVAAADDDIDFGAYDGLCIVHSGAGQESDINNNSKDQIWSAFFPQPLVSLVLSDSLAYQVPGIPTNDLTAEGDTVYVEAAARLPETESQDGFTFGLMGVYTHELGHVMVGWPDLYDTTPDDPSQGLGAFCLMAAGTWNANGNVPGEPSAWCRMYAGWTDAMLIDSAPEGGRTVTLTYVEKDRPALDDTLLARIPIAGDEYFLVACRKPDEDGDGDFTWTQADTSLLNVNFWTDSYDGAEFDFFTPNLIPASPTFLEREGAGIYIWHVDESVVTFGFPFNIVNGDPHHMGIDLEEADGVQDLEFDVYGLLSFGSPDDAFRDSTATEFAPWTEPASLTSFGGPSGVVIDQIGAADTVMTFRLQFLDGDGSPGVPEVREGWPLELPETVGNSQPLAADLDGDGADEFVVVGTDGAVTVLTADGTVLAPDTLSIGGTPAGSPLAGDVDGDGSLEVVVAGRDGGVHVLGVTGGPGDPTVVREQTTATDTIGVVEGALVDLDMDDRLELVLGSAHVSADTTDTLGAAWLVNLDTGVLGVIETPAPVTAAPAVVMSDQGTIIIYPLSRGGLWVHDVGQDASEVVRETVLFGPPSVADLDRDGRPEVMATGSDGGIHVFHLDPSPGTWLLPAAGWPVSVGALPGAGVSAADVDADGFQEVLGLGTSGSVHVLNYNGVYMAGWPASFDVPYDVYFDYAPPHPAPLAVDLTGDDRLEMVVVMSDGRAEAMTVSGGPRTLQGWPIQGGHGSVPVIGDFDDDGRAELLAIESAVDAQGEPMWSRATVWNVGSPLRERADDWRMHRRNPARDAVVAGSQDPLDTSSGVMAEVYCQPNPGRADGSWVHYRLGVGIETVDIRFYDAAGAEVRRLEGTVFPNVDNLVHWDGLNESGNRVAPGLYVYRVLASGGGRSDRFVGKLALVR